MINVVLHIYMWQSQMNNQSQFQKNARYHKTKRIEFIFCQIFISQTNEYPRLKYSRFCYTSSTINNKVDDWEQCLLFKVIHTRFRRSKNQISFAKSLNACYPFTYCFQLTASYTYMIGHLLRHKTISKENHFCFCLFERKPKMDSLLLAGVNEKDALISRSLENH